MKPVNTSILIVINKNSDFGSFTLGQDIVLLIERSNQCTILCTSEIKNIIKQKLHYKNINFVIYDLNPYFDEAKYNLHLLLDQIRSKLGEYSSSIVNPIFDSRNCLEFLRIYQKKLNKTNLLELTSTICQLKACSDINKDSQILFVDYNVYEVYILQHVLEQITIKCISVNTSQVLPLNTTSFVFVLKKFIQNLSLLTDLYYDSKLSICAEPTNAKKNIVIVIDDIWHLYYAENKLQSTYFPNLYKSLDSCFDIHWFALISTRFKNNTSTDLREALQKELRKQKVSFVNIIEFTFHSLRLWLQLYVIRFQAWFMLKFKSSNIHGIILFEVDDLIGRIHQLLSNNIRRRALENNITDNIYLDRKPFSNVAKSIKNLNPRSNSTYVGLQHGITNINQLGYTFSEYEINKNSSSLLLPDFMLVFGQNTYEFMSNNNFPSNHLSISGSFVYTDLKPHLTCSIINEYKNILIALQYPGEDLYNLVNTIAKSLLTINNYKIVIRPHPTYGGSGSQASKILISQGIPTDKFSISSNKLEDDLSSSDLLITQSSSIVFDYLRFSKPILIYNGHSKFNNNYLFNEYQCFEYFVTSQDLTTILTSKHILIKYALRYLFAERHVRSSTTPSNFLMNLIDKRF